MSQDPYDQEIDRTFDEITQPARHPSGRTYRRSTRDQLAAFAGCAGLIVVLTLAVIAVIVVWRMV